MPPTARCHCPGTAAPPEGGRFIAISEAILAVGNAICPQDRPSMPTAKPIAKELPRASDLHIGLQYGYPMRTGDVANRTNGTGSPAERGRVPFASPGYTLVRRNSA